MALFHLVNIYAATATALLLWIAAGVIYNLFFHPLRSFPGPISHRVSRIPYCVRLLRGTLPFDMLDLYNKYGDVVRIAPNELAFSDASAWKDIMGHRAGAEMAKYEGFYRPVDNMPSDIINADREEHTRLRRQLAHGFSDRSMRDQETIIAKYIDLLIRRLHENSASGPVDLVKFLNYTTFDVIGDLAFGDSFGCLDNSDYHPWVKMILDAASIGTVLQAAGHFPSVKRLLLSLVPKSMMEKHEQHQKMVRAKLLTRMEMVKERPDLIEGLLKKKDEWNLSIERLQANSSILVIGGSETTATLLSGVTFLLLVNPAVLSKLVQEVRSTFQKESEIDIVSVNKLSYMLACLDEALRMYPPVPNGLPRVVPPGGAMISGRFVPENTIVAIHQWATYHKTSNFRDPFGYHPERFLLDDPDPTFANDKREVLQPFHVGPRNCLGRNLAYTEMRLILARLVFNFDLQLMNESRDWMKKQKIFNFWMKGELLVKLTPRVKQ